MLSILIPTYNFNIVSLVKELHSQCTKLSIEFEIICYEDGSSLELINQNKPIKTLKNVIYKSLEKNIGRAAIRNLLSKEASHEYQIFMDCDSATVTNDYVKNYLLNKDVAPVIFGGRVYTEVPPKNPKKILRWIYGTKREVFSEKQRMLKPYKFFMTNNFLVKKEVITKFPFQENLIGYGHEDTVFAQDLKKEHIKVIHIENPLCHIGLENADEFLFKTINGVKNLAQLIKSNQIDEDNKLFATYKNLKTFGLANLILFVLNFLNAFITSNLISKKPNLWLFDLFKLRLLIINMKTN